MTSTRLPGKVLADVGGRPALALMLHRLARSRELDELAVATSDEASDDPVAELAESLGVPVVRGPLADVLARYVKAGDALGADAVARMTGDCPLIDPAVVDRVVARFRAGDEDYVSNVESPRTYPVGMDTEVIAREALERVAATTTEPEDREHVTIHVRRNPDRFTTAAVELDPPHGDAWICVDTAADLALVRRVVAATGLDAGLDELLRALP